MPEQNSNHPDGKFARTEAVKSGPFGQTDNMTPQSGGPGSKPGSPQVPIKEKVND